LPQFLPQPTSVRNHLLASLPPGVLAQLLPKLRCISFTQRDTLYLAETTIDAVYFPETGWASLVTTLADGLQAEVGLVGREGMVGMPLAFGVETSFVEAMVQGPGTALRMDAGAFRQVLDETPELRPLLFRFSEALHDQTTQTAACNGRHGLEQRLARWLLMALDRTDGDVLPLTQDLLAMMLCVHRPSVTVAARILQRANLIQYSSGTITVLDRPGLEATSCECYEIVKRQYGRLLG